MRKGILKQNWRCGLIGVAACSMLSFSSSAVFAGNTQTKTPEAFSQQQGKVAVKGVVKDSKGEPIIGATVKTADGKVGAITDIDGNFSIDIKPGSSIEISSIGYTPTTVKVGQNRQLAIVLKDDSQMLNEVVAIGYGAATKKKDLSAAVGVVSNVDELAVRPVTSTEGMLQGQLAGVTVQADGGDPTAAPNIVIRGQGSQNGDNVWWTECLAHQYHRSTTSNQL